MRIRSCVRVAVLVAVLLGALVLPAAPSDATITGKTTFHCTAYFVSFPGENLAWCDSDVLDPSVADVHLSGIDDFGGHYIVAGVGHFRADFDYNEQCSADGLFPLIGTATGNASVTGVPAARTRPGPQIGEARLDTGFVWTRVGTSVVILTFNTGLTFSFGTHATAAENNTGHASFVPLLTTADVCPVGGVLRAKVTGEDTSPL